MRKVPLDKLEEKLKKLSDQRERNIDRYIIPIEEKMMELRGKIRELNGTPKF